ncbi:phage tail protein [Pseudovibrio sp. Tun.PSC04-5.I4]|uniref:phage tail protein n=1 Tax=Pseudovibrio sp. Tun.PSC04-5.I4 TaxID=1798213 RepID=UPI000888C8CA|nr:phage tail protein [Pseudovibrio sp. Tun.PSC04-5.I4]SDR07505.1 Phage tail-collar fibre protein [Pseudovibrio sp. Tun.PSC04-5.I4]
MSDPLFYTRLTDVGSAALNAAITGGQGITISELALGDGNGAAYDPDGSETVLKNEVYRTAITSITPDPQNPAWLIIEAIVPPNAGGWWVREAGIFDEDGKMFAIAKYPEAYKAKLSDGSAATLTIQIVLQVTNTDSIQLVVNPLDGYATKGWVVSAYPWASGVEAKDASVEKKVIDPKRLHQTLAEVAAPKAHDHQIADVVGLATALAAKSGGEHTHAYGELEDKPTTMAELGLVDAYTKVEVDQRIANLVASAPGALNTLDELASALGDNPNFATEILNAVGSKLDASKISAFSLTVLALTTSSAWREKLGLGSAATKSTDYFAHAGNIAALSAAAGVGQGLGEGQAWYDVSSSRSRNVKYQNTSGRLMLVQILTSNCSVQWSKDGITWVTVSRPPSGHYVCVVVVVAHGHFYRNTEGYRHCSEFR